MKIGILDSGLAGLVTARYLKQSLSEDQLVYFGDTAHMPYESKGPELIRHRAIQGVNALIRESVEVLVITCPTIASIAGDSVRQLIDIPVLDLIATNIDHVLQKSKSGRIGILSSTTAVDSRIYKDLWQAKAPQAKVYCAACPLLPHLIENGWARKPETRMIIKKYMQPLKIRQIDTLVLGTSHAIYLRKLIQAKIGKRVAIADPRKPLAASIQNLSRDRLASKSDKPHSNAIRVLVNDINDHHQALSALYFKRRVSLEAIIS